VTYAGQPLYRFFLDQAAGDTQGANLDDPVTSTAGIWYLLQPRRGTPATGPAQLQLETAPLDGTGPDETVLAATMNNDFSAFPDASFPVYTLSPDRGHGRSNESSCQGLCAIYWPPVLTSRRPEAGPGVEHHGLGVIVRPDGSHQVTYDGQPLHLFNRDAYIASSAAGVFVVGAGPTGATAVGLGQTTTLSHRHGPTESAPPGRRAGSDRLRTATAATRRTIPWLDPDGAKDHVDVVLPNLEQAKVDLRPVEARLVELDPANLACVDILERDPGHARPVLAVIDDAHRPERRAHLENCEVGVVSARILTTDLDDDSLPLVLVEPVQRLAERHLCHRRERRRATRRIST
jgi:predicted lipoprotein with Yx(FWY)xxD motif